MLKLKEMQTQMSRESKIVQKDQQSFVNQLALNIGTLGMYSLWRHWEEALEPYEYTYEESAEDTAQSLNGESQQPEE